MVSFGNSLEGLVRGSSAKNPLIIQTRLPQTNMYATHQDTSHQGSADISQNHMRYAKSSGEPSSQTCKCESLRLYLQYMNMRSEVRRILEMFVDGRGVSYLLFGESIAVGLTTIA